MKTRLILLLLLLFFSVLNAQWTRVSTNMKYGINRIYVLDAVENFCASIVGYQYFANGKYYYEKALFKTYDNGLTWERINYDSLTTLDLIAAQDFEVVDSLKYFVATDGGKLLATTDGGKTWETKFYNTTLTKFMNYVEMFDYSNGVAMGDPPYNITPSDTNKALFLKTNDGGDSWQIMQNNQMLNASGDTWRRLDFISPEIGFFSDNTSQAVFKGLLKTNDGGNNWSIVNTDGSCMVMKFYDENFGIKIDYDNSQNITIYRTFNGGADWEKVINTLDGWGNDIEFIKGNPALIWATDKDNLYFSNDSGKTWTKQILVSTGISARDIDFVNDKQGWVQCDKYIYFTNNLGGFLTDIEDEKSNNLLTEFSLSQNYPNPFNPSTMISYSIPEAGFVQLKVYNSLGEEIATLVNEYKEAGDYNSPFSSTNYQLPSGIYFYKLQSGQFSETKKMILLR